MLPPKRGGFSNFDLDWIVRFLETSRGYTPSWVEIHVHQFVICAPFSFALNEPLVLCFPELAKLVFSRSQP